MTDAEKLACSPAPVSSITITDIGEDQRSDISSDEEEEEQVMVTHSPDASISSIVSTAMVTRKQPPSPKTNEPKDPAHRIMKRPQPKLRIQQFSNLLPLPVDNRKSLCSMREEEKGLALTPAATGNVQAYR